MSYFRGAWFGSVAGYGGFTFFAVAGSTPKIVSPDRMVLDKDSNWQTIVHLAASANLKGLLKKLIDSKASLADKDNQGNTPLHYACQIVEVISTAVYDLSNNPSLEPNTIADPSANALLDPSSAAILDTSSGVVHQLLAAKAPLDISNNQGLLPLHVAALYNNENAVRAILDICSSSLIVNTSDAHGRTPLYLAFQARNEGIVDSLLDASANVYTADKNGIAPIHLAAAGGMVKSLNRLLELSGALVHVEDTNGWTPLHWAAYSGQHYCVAALNAKNANKTKKTHNADLPLHLAARMGHQLSALLLSI
jgi:ankyrin repeat protein